eukprot:1411172-Rhodomonas_salina.2
MEQDEGRTHNEFKTAKTRLFFYISYRKRARTASGRATLHGQSTHDARRRSHSNSISEMDRGRNPTPRPIPHLPETGME